jgi:iron complex outermembrane receptor protein
MLCATSLYATDELDDKSLESILNETIELKSAIGSREQKKHFLDSKSPVDVITAKQIEESGQTKLTNVLKYFVPGFNTIETSVSDGTDHINGFTLRGMNSDQILVLVNGKRLHTSALMNEIPNISGGTTHVDLNTIPVVAIEQIEVLRDGAAAQYGTDAISGVISIILKGQSEKNIFSLHAGQRKEGDGEQVQLDSFFSVPLNYDGFVNLAISANLQNRTQRAGEDRRLDPPSVQTRMGLPDLKNISGALNIEVVQYNDNVLYSNAIVSYRDSESSTFYRTPDETRPIYPNGFLPIMNAKILDYSLTLGIKGAFSDDTQWDVSNVYGYNNFDYSLNNTMNYGLGAVSPTHFNNGNLTFIQNTTNIDLKKNIGNFNLAVGLEYRYENYIIEAGDEASYTGTGSQGFSGFTPDDETDSRRDVYAAYIDTVYYFNHYFSIEGALRLENYSDFGSNQNIKVSSSYKPIDKLLFRTTVSTGFRAPSLAQSNFSHTSQFVTNDQLSLKGIFTPSHAAPQILGAQDLEPENSTHYTVGTVFEFSNQTSLMIDYFYIEVDDRILLSDKKSASTPEEQVIFDAHGVSNVSYFTNAINTKTQGIDIKLNSEYVFDDDSSLNSTIWYYYGETEIIGFNESISLNKINDIENGQPKSNFRILNNYKVDNFNITLNISRFGSFASSLGSGVSDVDSVITTDLNVNYKVNNNIDISIGGSNILDVTIDKWNVSNKFLGYDGILTTTNNSPIGVSGAYYYIQTSINF